jgi:hypothetical protein
VEFVVKKVVLGKVYSEYFGFPCQSSFHQILHLHNHPGLVAEVAGLPNGPSLDSTPHYAKLKNNNNNKYNSVASLSVLWRPIAPR